MTPTQDRMGNQRKREFFVSSRVILLTQPQLIGSKNHGQRMLLCILYRWSLVSEHRPRFGCSVSRPLARSYRRGSRWKSLDGGTGFGRPKVRVRLINPAYIISASPQSGKLQRRQQPYNAKMQQPTSPRRSCIRSLSVSASSQFHSYWYCDTV